MPTATKKVVQSKSTVKKPAVKKNTKAVGKVSTAKKAKAKSLVYSDNKKSFWVHDGQILNSLMALHDALLKMEKDTFTHHVTKDRHDFAVWVDTVLGDSECAFDLKKTKTIKSAVIVLAKHLKSYNL